MVEPVLIETREEYDYCLERGHDALIHRFFLLPIELRVQIQKETFGRTILGRGNIPQANQRYYYWMWDHKPHICENCQHPLHQYSATFVSHILSRGAHPEMAHDPRNSNILCKGCHDKWENETTRKTMRIYPANIIIIELLKTEYQILN